MSADGGIELFWGDMEHRFRMAIGEFRELQEKVNLRRIRIGAPLVGPMDLVRQLQANNAWPDDVRDVIRLGLVGGGMEPAAAHRLLVTYFDDVDRYPPLSNMKPAFMILLAGLTGPIEDAKKKTTRAKRPRRAKTPSTSPSTTAPAAP
jgi:Phage tail tube protein, GTA-gp10